MCETELAKKSFSIELPNEDPSIFQYILGYLYFQRFNVSHGWGNGHNEIFMKTYIMATKFELTGLKTAILHVWNPCVPITEYLRLVRLVYDAEAADAGFRGHFKCEVMAILEDLFDGRRANMHRDTPSISSLALTASRGGKFVCNLTEALMDSKKHNQQKTHPNSGAKSLCPHCANSNCEYEEDRRCVWLGQCESVGQGNWATTLAFEQAPEDQWAKTVHDEHSTEQ